MKVPRHPVSERGAFWFHLGFALIGALHIAGGIGMGWFHWVGAMRHYRAIGKEE